MKIASCTTFVVGNPPPHFGGRYFLLVKLTTDDGIDSNGVHAAVSRTDGEIASAYAYSFGTGDTYTVYVGDHEIDRDGVGVDTLKAPSGGMLATIFLRASEQLVAGSVVDLDFVPIVDTGGGAEVGGFGPDDLTGSATVIGVDDDRICFEIDTSDPQQEVHGTVSAEIVN